MTANTPKSRKAKGRVFQQQVREDILEGMDLDPKDVLSTPMGQAGPDIYFAAAARELFPFGVECKHVDRLDLWGAIRQTEINAFGAGLVPLLVIKKSRGDPYAVIPWKAFLTMAHCMDRKWSH
jgi:hypothetical protein